MSVQLDYVPLRELSATDDLLGVIAFGDVHPLASLVVPIPQLGPEPLVEVWRGDGAVFGTEIREGGDLERDACGAYRAILRDAANRGAPHLLRAWNHIRDINCGAGEMERYKAFCAGRAEAFATAGWTNQRLPAASGVGMHAGGLSVYYLASSRPGVYIENPRQVAAYEYPRQYGRRSPSFARATLAEGLLMTAGTASVVGHRTVHTGNLVAQLDETLVNLDALALAAGAKGLAVFDRLKIYVRNRNDYPQIAERVAAAMRGAQTLYLESDICRSDLLLEIEAVGRV